MIASIPEFKHKKAEVGASFLKIARRKILTIMQPFSLNTKSPNEDDNNQMETVINVIQEKVSEENKTMLIVKEKVELATEIYNKEE